MTDSQMYQNGRSLLLAEIALALLLAAGNASAAVPSFGVFDYNTRAPVIYAIVTVSNDTGVVASNLTDATGYVDLVLEAKQYNITAAKTGYIPETRPFDVATENSSLFSLVPLSTTGIIRVRFNDLTIGLGEREYCIFYEINNRLAGCYHGNDTVSLLVNQNYTLRPQIRHMDLLSSPSNLEKYGFMFVGVLLSGFAVLLTITVIAVYFIRKAWRTK